MYEFLRNLPSIIQKLRVYLQRTGSCSDSGKEPGKKYANQWFIKQWNKQNNIKRVRNTNLFGKVIYIRILVNVCIEGHLCILNCIKYVMTHIRLSTGHGSHTEGQLLCVHHVLQILTCLRIFALINILAAIHTRNMFTLVLRNMK